MKLSNVAEVASSVVAISSVVLLIVAGAMESERLAAVAMCGALVAIGTHYMARRFERQRERVGRGW